MNDNSFNDGNQDTKAGHLARVPRQQMDPFPGWMAMENDFDPKSVMEASLQVAWETL